MLRGIHARLRPLAGSLVVFGVLGCIVAAGWLFPNVALADDTGLQGNILLNFIGTFIASVVNFIGNMLGSITLTLIEVVVINVLNYNNFANSTIVTLGWTLTRDVVNMMVVIVLLIIAIKTILGLRDAHWEQQLPRLFLGVVFVNFSRTICGLAIDASQVVMMTFANALLDIAAGNFAQLMVMPEATQYSADTLENLTGTGVSIITIGSNIANAYAKLLVQLAVFIVILLLAIAFIWRIIVLWVLVIMSPIAFFAWGAMDVVKFLGSAWSEWTKTFTAALVLGPMLTFFLWLALAAASNGNLAQTEAFPAAEKTTTYGQVTLEVFESTNLTGLLLGVAFLMIGMQQSASWASKLGGFASAMINEKMGKRALKGAHWASSRVMGAPGTLARTGFQAAGLGANKLGYTGLGKGLNTISRATGALMESPLQSGGKTGRWAAGKAAQGLGAVGAATGIDIVSSAGSAIGAQLHGLDEKEKKAAKDRLDHMSKKQKAIRLRQAMDGTGPVSMERDADAKMLKAQLLTDKDFRAAYEASLDPSEKHLLDEHIGKVMGEYDHDPDHRPIDKAEWDKARSRFIDIYSDEVDEKKAREFIDSDDFNGKLMRDKAMDNANVQAGLEGAFSRTEQGRRISKLDEANRGGYGAGKVKPAVAAAVASGEQARMNELFKRGGEEAVSLDQLNGIATRPGPTPGTTVRIDNTPIIASMIASNTRMDNIAADEVRASSGALTRSDVENVFVQQVFETQTAQNITQAFANGQIREDQFKESMFDAGNTNGDQAILALAQSNADLAKTNAATRADINNAIQTRLEDMERAGSISIDDASKVRAKLLNAGKKIEEMVSGLDMKAATNPSFSVSAADQQRVQQLIRANPTAIGQLDGPITGASAQNGFTRAVVSGLSREDIQRLGNQMRETTDAATKAAIKKAMAVIDEALSVHEATTPARDANEIKRLQALRNEYRAADRYMT